MAYAVNRAMAFGLSVVLSDAGGTLLGEGRIARKEIDEAFGLRVYLDGQSDAIPLPFIKRMTLKGD